MALAVEPIPFVAQQESGIDPLGGATSRAMNVVLDSKGTVRRRPGIRTWEGGPTIQVASGGVHGLHHGHDGFVYAVGGTIPGCTKLYRLGVGDNDVYEIQGEMSSDTRPVFAETEAMLVIASGRNVQRMKFELPSKLQILPGGPPVSSHVVAQGGRLLVLDTKGDRSKIHYSAPAAGTATIGHEQWGAVRTSIGTSGFFSAEARPDPIVALGENTNEIFAFGTTNVQTFGEDPALKYAPITTKEFGCLSASSVIRDDQSFAYLDSRRRIVHTDGRNFAILSDPIKADLDAMVRVDDAYGYRVMDGPIDCLCFTFPTDRRTLAYQRGGGWSTWMGWNETGNTWKRYPVLSHVYMPGTATNVVGLIEGDMAEISLAAPTDLGAVVPAYIETGFINHKSDSKKRCVSVKVSLRRGEHVLKPGTAEVFGHLQWRDDGGKWGSPRLVSFGSYGDREVVMEFRSLGVYRRRQWRFSFHGLGDFVLAGATEEYEVLSN